MSLNAPIPITNNREKSLLDRRTSMKLAISALLALAAVCILLAVGEQTAYYWSTEDRRLSLNGSYQEAVASYDRALELDTSNASLLIGKGWPWPISADI
jgi:hypothetical protein